MIIHSIIVKYFPHQLKTPLFITHSVKLSYLFALLILFALQNAYCQEIEKPETPDSTHKAVTLEKPKLTPIIAPVASPEVDLMLLLGGLFTFKVNILDPFLQRSSIPFSIGYSTNGSFNSNFRPYIYGKNDNLRLFGDIWLKDMPDNYWGVGYENGKNVPKSDSTTAYKRNWWQVYLNIIRKIKPNLFAGINLDLNKTKASELNTRMKEDPLIINQGTNFRNSGIGFIIQYDSRDLSVNAYSGLYLSLTASIYRKFLNGNTNYDVYFLDYRQYKSIKKPGRTLAWSVKSRIATSGVPWTEMSMVGTPFDLRGYIWGRYRDKAMISGIIEYRHMFIRKNPDKNGNMMSRHGFVSWIGGGGVSPSIRVKQNWLPNIGVGYRFEVQKRMNARVDFGLGEDSFGIYVSFNEAF